MATKLAETRNKTVIIIHNPLKFFPKTVLALYPRIWTGISVLLFFLPFYNVNYRYEQLFKIFCSGQKQQTTQSTARGPLKTARKC